MAGRRQGAVLPFLGPQDDGRPGDNGTNFDAGPAVVLFQTAPRQSNSLSDLFVYDVSREGQRFLINTEIKRAESQPMSIILNWPAELNK